MKVDLPEGPITKRRKITRGDLEAMADMLVKRITEKDACHVLGINPQKWYDWKRKHRNDTKFEALLSRVRGNWINGRINNIQSFEHKDWRASKALLEVHAPEIYGPRPKETNVQVNVQAADSQIIGLIDKIYAGKPVQQIECKPTLQLATSSEALPVEKSLK